MTHASDADYVPPIEPAVVDAVERWRALRFGALLHFAPGSQWPGPESWTLCSEDEPWISRTGEFEDDYTEYRRAYERLPESFDPTFDASDWIETIADAGMRYVISPTKHHDGFCMWDTAETDYRITSPSCAYSRSAAPDVFGALVTAAQSRGLTVGAYFSKPDWHSQDYWWGRFATPDRNVNYDPQRYPERWERFVEFTHAQIREITTHFGRIDILWLDGGWVRGAEAVTAFDPELVGRSLGHPQDIDMPGVARQVRDANPATIIVDRTVHGPFENYLTPEQSVPDSPLDSPWESCITLGDDWHSVENDTSFKSANEVLTLLFRTASCGGNLLLGIGPTSRGELLPGMREELAQIGSWLRANGEAIYDTTACSTPNDNGVYFTSASDRCFALIPIESLDASGTVSFSAPCAPRSARALDGTELDVGIAGTGVTVRARELPVRPLAVELLWR